MAPAGDMQSRRRTYRGTYSNDDGKYGLDVKILSWDDDGNIKARLEDYFIYKDSPHGYSVDVMNGTAMEPDENGNTLISLSSTAMQKGVPVLTLQILVSEDGTVLTGKDWNLTATDLRLQPEPDYSPIEHNYTGFYYIDKCRKRFELMRVHITPEGSFSAVFSTFRIGNPDNRRYSEYEVHGKVVPDADGNFAATMYSTEDGWLFNPGRERRIDRFNLVFSADGTQVRSARDDLAFGIATDARPNFPYGDIVKTYKGWYYINTGDLGAHNNHGLMGLELAITALDEKTGAVAAEFRFGPHEHGDPDMPAGSFSMSGILVRVGFSGEVVLLLMGKEWIDNPGVGWDMLGACVSIDADRCILKSACGDNWNIYAEDRSAWRQKPSPMRPVEPAGGRYGDIVKRYVGTAYGYNLECGVDLKIVRADDDGSVEAYICAYSHVFYNETNCRFTLSRMTGRVCEDDDGDGLRLYLGNCQKLIGSVFNDMVVFRISADRSEITWKEGSVVHMDAGRMPLCGYDSLVRTYTGNWANCDNCTSTSKFKLSIDAVDQYGYADARLSFWDVSSDSDVPFTSYTLKGRIFAADDGCYYASFELMECNTKYRGIRNLRMREGNRL